MTVNNENTSLTEVAIVQLPAIEQNELIAQLMRQIVELRVELQKKQDFLIPTVNVNTLGDRRLPLHFTSLNSYLEHVQNNPPSNPAQNPSTIYLTTPNLHQNNTSCQAPHPLQSLNPNPQVFPPFQNQTQITLKYSLNFRA